MVTAAACGVVALCRRRQMQCVLTGQAGGASGPASRRGLSPGRLDAGASRPVCGGPAGAPGLRARTWPAALVSPGGLVESAAPRSRRAGAARPLLSARPVGRGPEPRAECGKEEAERKGRPPGPGGFLSEAGVRGGGLGRKRPAGGAAARAAPAPGWGGRCSRPGRPCGRAAGPRPGLRESF